MLSLTVALHRLRMFFTVAPPIIRVARSPLLRAIPAHLPILRVSRDLLTVIVGAALPLAGWLATHQLPRLIFRRLEFLLTVAASPLGHTGGCRTPGRRI